VCSGALEKKRVQRKKDCGENHKIRYRRGGELTERAQCER
jgi:hypothetical protein